MKVRIRDIRTQYFFVRRRVESTLFAGGTLFAQSVRPFR
jgi:hypothetical protein